MKIILTGASGFLGKYIYNELCSNNQLITVSRSNADINADLAKEIPNLYSADLVIHCAGKAHSVPKNEQEKAAFFDVNFNGTLNLLKGLEKTRNFPHSFVFISTVAVYGRDKGILITEEQTLQSEEAYGQSKIQAEKLVHEWCQRYHVICTILRLPLLVGENPPGNLGAMIKGIKRGYYFNIAGGKAKKSMVLAADVAKIIPIVATIGGIYNLTDGIHPSFAELSDVIKNHLGKKKVMNLPFWLANIFAAIGGLIGEKAPINTRKLFKITSDLTFDDSKAKNTLCWKPNPVLDGLVIRK
jgi:nucleoside-diphosphate-sugar epimerase